MIFNTEQVFKEIADQNGWSFVYGRSDHQNLLTGALGEMETMFDSSREIKTILYVREYSTDLTENVKVEIILGYYSNPNDDHTEINEKHLYPSKTSVSENIIEVLNEDYDITNIYCTDKINHNDVNVSGAFATFNLKYYSNEC